MLNQFKRLGRRGLDALADQLYLRIRQKLEGDSTALLARTQACGVGVEVEGRFRMTGPEGASIGNNVHIGDNTVFRAEGGLIIGDNTHVGPNVTILTTNHEYEGTALPYDHRHRYRPVTIGRNVWIGMNANVVPGTRIGDGAIIGMGSTVSGVVPPGAIVAPATTQVLGYRDPQRYADLEAERQYGGAKGYRLDPESVAAFRPTLAEAVPFFVVSTGRSGSTTIARALNQHPDVTCLHEPHPALIRLSTLWAEGARDRDRLRDDLGAIYEAVVTPTRVYGESDQNLSLLLDPLLERFPEARVVWLIRDGRDVVASGMARGWYGGEVARGVLRGAWDEHRLHGHRLGDVPEAEWAAMTPFEKNCWYWAYINRTVRERLEPLDPSQWVQVKLETMAGQVDDVFALLGVLPTEVAVERHNPSQRPTRPATDWTDEEQAAFARICGAEMDISYPGWRSGDASRLAAVYGHESR